eukprot:8249302-Pyramimonas_sp.AAC.1
MRRLMTRPRMQVKQFVFVDKFSGDPPLRGSPGVLAPYGNVLSGNASPHVEAQDAIEPISYSQPVVW